MLHTSERSKVQGANDFLVFGTVPCASFSTVSLLHSSVSRHPRHGGGRLPAGELDRRGASDESDGYEPHDSRGVRAALHTGSDFLCLHERISAPATLRIPDAWIRPVIAEHPQPLGRSPIQEHLPAFERGLRIGIEAEMP